jgi:hypothetical protein
MAVLVVEKLEPKTAWQRVFRDGIAPQLSMRSLLALQRGLRLDDLALIQGATSNPPPLEAARDWPIQAACALAYAGWRGETRESVGAVEDFFAQLCWEADKALAEPAAIRHFLNWFDETERTEMRRLLLAEVQLALTERLGRIRSAWIAGTSQGSRLRVTAP